MSGIRNPYNGELADYIENSQRQVIKQINELFYQLDDKATIDLCIKQFSGVAIKNKQLGKDAIKLLEISKGLINEL